jgi:hypothetical protein
VGAKFLWVLSLALAAGACDRIKPPRPTDVFGCYRLAGGPDISITPSILTVYQPNEIRLVSKLVYVKGWAFQIEKWLDFKVVDGKRLELETGSANGQYLFLSREPIGANAPPQFRLHSREDLLAVTYRKAGESCD